MRKTIIDCLEQTLRQHGADGLYNDVEPDYPCGCCIEDLVCCGEDDNARYCVFARNKGTPDNPDMYPIEYDETGNPVMENEK